MTAAKDVIKENDVVELRDPVGKWPAGTIGAVVSERGEAKRPDLRAGRNGRRLLARLRDR